MMRRWILLCFFAATAASAGNWHVPTSSRELKNPVPVNGQTAAAAAGVYTRHCLECHGELGAGDGVKVKVAYDLRGILAPLTDGELYWKITHGVGKMPSFAGILTDEERWLMVNHLRALGKTLAAAKTASTTGAP